MNANWWSQFKSDWDDGWRIIGKMGGCKRGDPRIHAKSAALIGCVGIAGLSLALFDGVWFYIALAWFVFFGIVLIWRGK